MEKLTWTLARRPEVDPHAFRQEMLTDLPQRVVDLMPAVIGVTITLQDLDAYSGARVPVDGVEQPADVLLEVTASERFVALDPLHEMLHDRCGHVQGWRMKPTVIYDASTPSAIGEASAFVSVNVFVERLDGTSPRHFDQNWYKHAGHPDGQEADSPGSLAERRREEDAMPGGRYIQNRVIEPVTPTAWLVHGYTQLLFPIHVPPVEGTPPYERTRGEEPFDRWPPRVLQGREYRVRVR